MSYPKHANFLSIKECNELKRAYIGKIGIKDYSAMRQAFIDIHKSEPMIITKTKSIIKQAKYVRLEVETLPLGHKKNIIFNKSHSEKYCMVYDRYSVRAKEIQYNFNTFCNIFNQISQINVKEW